jgi:diphthine-ammonia ligase
MYQTAGAALVPLYRAALAIPLYQHPIRGRALNTDLAYAPADADETESLVPLLRAVRAAHPDATALSSGAIRSTYQRSRIESVAARLGLVPVAYLWEYGGLPRRDGCPPSEARVLADMCAAGLEARVVKVAAGGLGPPELWLDVLAAGGAARVESAVGRFGGSVRGEGGEYETLVVRGPRWGGWLGRIEVAEGERWVGEGGGGEVWLGFTGGQVVDMGEEAEGGGRERFRVPAVWDARFEALLDETEASEAWSDEGGPEGEGPSPADPDWISEQVTTADASTVTISNLSATPGSTPAAQMSQIGSTLCALLAAHDRSADDIVFTSILLRSMADFAAINAVYGRLFPKPNPPARATIAAGAALPPGIDVLLSATVDRGSRSGRRGLHVQSRSYWAPANIGPYSQAISVPLPAASGPRANSPPSLVYIAGQIPLLPASMELYHPTPPARFRHRAALALQHLWRIATSTSVTLFAGAVAFLAGPHAAHKAATAAELWARIHRRPDDDDDDEPESAGPDAWDRRYGGQRSFVPAPEPARRLPDFDTVLGSEAADPDPTPGFFAVEVSGLPRGADVEWVGCGIAGGTTVRCGACVLQGLRGRRCEPVGSAAAISFLDVPLARGGGPESGGETAALRALGLLGDGGERGGGHATLYAVAPARFAGFRGQLVPCRRVWGSGGVELAAGLVVRSVA